MSPFPCYQYHVGTKQEVFTGVKNYLKNCKDVYEVKNNECNKLFDELKFIELKISDSLKGDIDGIRSLQKKFENTHSEWVKLYTFLKSNETKFLLDLINLFLD